MQYHHRRHMYVLWSNSFLLQCACLLKNLLLEFYDCFVFVSVPNVSFQVYAPGFISRFLESHAVMFQGNAGLKPKEGEVTSRPWQWPINYRVSFDSCNFKKIFIWFWDLLCRDNSFPAALIVFICLAIRSYGGATWFF